MRATQNNIACPRCGTPVDPSDKSLECASCGLALTVINGMISVAGAKDVYYGEIDKAAVQTLNTDIAQHGRQEAFERLYAALEADTRFVDQALNEYATPWLPLMEATPGIRVLDMGPGWSHSSVHFARRGCEVMAVDSSLDRLRYLDTCFKEESLTNASVLHTDRMHELPFDDHTFTIAILHDVLDVLPEIIPGNPGEVQRAVLKEIRRVLKDDGTLVVSAENRWSWRYWAGAHDERSGLRYVSLLPRAVANCYARMRTGKPYRTWSHGIEAYQRMLRQAGFQSIDVFSALQDHRFCRHLFEVSDPSACTYAVERLMWCGRSSKLLLEAARKVRALGWLVPGYVLMASPSQDTEVQP